jgi:hypothetical protein
MRKYNISLYIPGRSRSEEKVIECGRLEIRENCYCFWTNVYGETSRLVASYPIQFTIVNEIYE